MGKYFIAKLIENNLYNYLRFTALYSNFISLNSDQNISHISCDTSSWPNFIFSSIQGQTMSSSCLRKFLKTLVINKQPQYVLLSEENEEGNVMKKVLNNSLLPISQWKTMAIDNGALLVNISSDFRDFEIEEVKEEGQLIQWVKVAGTGFGQLDPKIFQRQLGNENVHLLQAKINNEVAATILLYMNDGIGGLYHLATVQKFREKGLGTFLCTHAIRKAFEKKCKMVVAHLSKKGYPMIKRLGFQEYGVIEVYLVS